MTKTEDIKRLLVSYYDGQTTEEEEETLRSYFNGDHTDAGLEEDRAFFAALQPKECPAPEGLEDRLSRQVSQCSSSPQAPLSISTKTHHQHRTPTRTPRMPMQRLHGH